MKPVSASPELQKLWSDGLTSTVSPGSQTPFPAASTASSAGCGAGAHSAASASTRPQPEELFGVEPLGVPPQVCSGLTVTGAQFWMTKVSIAVGSPLSCGFAERNSAVTPAACGAAML